MWIHTLSSVECLNHFKSNTNVHLFLRGQMLCDFTQLWFVNTCEFTHGNLLSLGHFLCLADTLVSHVEQVLENVWVPSTKHKSRYDKGDDNVCLIDTSQDERFMRKPLVVQSLFSRSPCLKVQMCQYRNLRIPTYKMKRELDLQFFSSPRLGQIRGDRGSGQAWFHTYDCGWFHTLVQVWIHTTRSISS